MKRIIVTAALVGCTVLIPAGCHAQGPPLAVVESVNLNRYAGTWYEIARYPNSFQRNCVDVTAEYSPRENRRVTVENFCREDQPNGRLRSIRGTARVVDTQTNAKLKVTFFWPFEGDYWIIELDADYSYAVVGEPSRNFLWILSRTPTLDEDLYQAILGRLPEKGYDPAALVRTPQSAGEVE